MVKALTMSKQREVAKRLRKLETELGTIHRSLLGPLCSGLNVQMEQVISLAQTMRITVIDDRPTVVNPPSPPPPSPKKAAVSDLVKRQIRTLGIYKHLGIENHPSDSDFVITTWGQLRREREAILAWIEEATKT
jgi:hypothetical protein